jgi:hypothetical protein
MICTYSGTKSTRNNNSHNTIGLSTGKTPPTEMALKSRKKISCKTFLQPHSFHLGFATGKYNGASSLNLRKNFKVSENFLSIEIIKENSRVKNMTYMSPG